MRSLYPAIKPYVTHSIKVMLPHVLHVEECGNPKGIPVLFVHGGPGAGCEAYHRQFFNPEKYRIVLFDQRGCGQSAPHACLEGNNTQALVSDMEVIREKLGIDTWVLFGGSWGSTLSLVYAQTHPERVRALILRGIFLCRQREIDWFYQEGASRIFPDLWQDFVEPIAPKKRGTMVKAYYELLTGDNEIKRMAAAKAWSLWEGRTATLKGRMSVVNHFADPYTALSLARIECHYFINKSFLGDNQILDDVDRIKHLPAVIVQGRYDVICPLESAWQLHGALPESKLDIINDAGHSASEPGIINALVRATDEIAASLS
ncbi:MAG: prolyl aminopeptidase [Gammaproteobacteria bacterium]